MIYLYNFLLTLLAPMWVPWMWVRARQRRETPNWAERFGNYDLTLDRTRPVVWLHAVSVGEVIAALPVVRALREDWPETQIVFSVTTSSGHRTAREKLAGSDARLVYFPIDVARFMWVAMGRVRPDVVAVFETELWMNFLEFAKREGATTLLVNGRISDRSLNRARWVQFFYEDLLRRVDRCLMQTEIDAERIRFLGARTAEVLGNTKFDEAETIPERAETRARFGFFPDEFVIVVGSTRGEEEEAFVVEALAALPREGLRILHAPRHLETVEGLAARVRGAFGTCARHTLSERGVYTLLDTYGELASAYAAGDVAVVGGGFSRLGGQNLIQPMACGVPVLHGKHMHNFRAVADEAVREGASQVCVTPASLTAALLNLMSDAQARHQMGERGRAIVTRHRGASQRYAEAIRVAAQR